MILHWYVTVCGLRLVCWVKAVVYQPQRHQYCHTLGMQHNEISFNGLLQSTSCSFI